MHRRWCILFPLTAPTKSMINNPWINRAAAFVLLIFVYTLGHVDGRDQATAAFNAHPACHQK